MTIHKRAKPRPDKIEVNLMGPEGNIFSLMALGLKLARELGLDDLYLRSFLIGMKAGSYDDAIQFFDSCFGEYVDLYREEKGWEMTTNQTNKPLGKFQGQLKETP